MAQKRTKIQFGMISRYVLLGGGALMAKWAQWLIKQGEEVVVLTSTRHAKEMIDVDKTKVALKDFLTKKKIKHHVITNISTDKRVSSLIKADTLGISFGAAWIFRSSFINKFKGRLLNCHGAPLPVGRGGGGFSWSILQKNKKGGAVIHRIDAGIDTGDVVYRSNFTFPLSCKTSKDYDQVYQGKVLAMLKNFTTKVKKKTAFFLEPQDELKSTYWPRLSTADHGFIDWNWNADDVASFIHAFDEPYEGAKTFIHGKQLVFLKQCVRYLKDSQFHPFQAGLVYRKTKDAIYVAGRKGSLKIRQVLNQKGKEDMRSIQLGDRFYTPAKYIESAYMYRAKYTPAGKS